jgi:hypothetical protein
MLFLLAIIGDVFAKDQNAYVIIFYLYGCVDQSQAELKLRKFFLICTGPYTYGSPRRNIRQEYFNFIIIAKKLLARRIHESQIRTLGSLCRLVLCLQSIADFFPSYPQDPREPLFQALKMITGEFIGRF